jgi:hypothetical protein
LTEYLHQIDGTCCGLYALCNAVRYFGRTTPEPDSPEWGDLAEQPIDNAAARLGLRRQRIEPADVSKHLPAMLVVYQGDKKRQIVLVTSAENGSLTLVNFRPEGPVVESVPLKSLRLPSPPLAGAWALTLA